MSKITYLLPHKYRMLSVLVIAAIKYKKTTVMCNFQTRRLKRLEEKGVNIAEVKNAMDYEKQQ